MSNTLQAGACIFRPFQKSLDHMAKQGLHISKLCVQFLPTGQYGLCFGYCFSGHRSPSWESLVILITLEIGQNHLSIETQCDYHKTDWSCIFHDHSQSYSRECTQWSISRAHENGYSDTRNCQILSSNTRHLTFKDIKIWILMWNYTKSTLDTVFFKSTPETVKHLIVTLSLCHWTLFRSVQ